MSSGAPVEHGTPIRMPSTALLCVDSADAYKFDTSGYRIDNNTPASIQINKQTPLLFGYMTRISLTEINLQWATPNVNENNNTLTIGVEDTSGSVFIGYYRIGLDQAFYTPNQLASSIEAALENLTISGDAVSWTVTHDKQAGYFTIEIGAATPSGKVYAFNIVPPGKNYTILDTASATTPSAAVYTGPVEDDLTYMLGLTPPFESSIYFYDKIIGGFASCQYTPYIDIVSNILTKNQNVRDNDTTLRNGQAKLARVYLSEPGCINQYDIDEDGAATKCNIVGVRPFTLHREFQTPKVIQWNTTENVDIIDLQVIDRLGFPIYIEKFVISAVPGDDLILGNTASFQFTVQATEV
jgi:hypothetical protein